VKEKLREALDQVQFSGKVEVLESFYDAPEYIDAFSSRTKKSWIENKTDHILFSFHGLPERHITKINSECLKVDCCEKVSERSPRCYRFQCFETARRIVTQMNLTREDWSVSFQSRIGGGWLKPYTDHEYSRLAQKGVRRLLVCSPSFVADCLETLEEIQVRGRNDFIKAGGQDLFLVPSLNSEKDWARGVFQLLQKQEAWHEFKST
jgi:ferrochelatase